MKVGSLENGYYISSYLEIDPIGNLYLFAQRHDQCIALWKVENGQVQLVHYLELERRSGNKHNQCSLFDKQQYEGILANMLKEYGVSASDIKETWGTPQLNEDTSYLSIHDHPDFTYHAMCHISSSMFMDMDIFHNEAILAFSVDGGSDNLLDKDSHKRHPFVCAYKAKNQNSIMLSPVYSPGVMWNFMSEYSGMLEGTLMALAEASDSTAYITFDDILCLGNSNSDSVYVHDELYKIIHAVEALEDKDVGVKFNGYDPRFSKKDNTVSMIMKIVQKMSLNIMDRNVDLAIEKYGIDPKDTYLAMSGGFSLNCPSNTHLINKYRFKGFIAPPCVSDSGIALGCGLYTFYQRTDGNFHFKLDKAFYGDWDDLEDFRKRNPSFDSFILSIDPFNSEKIVEDIIADPIVWFDERAEIGPRALGGRSIIGDPRRIEVKDKLNQIKGRQSWRPVAPIIKEAEVGNWFQESFISPFMLHAFHIKEDKRDLAPAIVHENGTARIQTVSDDGCLLSQTLNAFGRKTGIPILCNTSLNDKGEPIINRIEEALSFALQKGIKVCYINGNRIELQNHSAYGKNKPYQRPLEINVWRTLKERARLLQEYNPLHLDRLTILYYILLKVDDPNKMKDVWESRILSRSARVYLNSLPKLMKDKIMCAIQYEIFNIDRNYDWMADREQYLQ